jgi:hypothetical protein
MPDGVFFLAGLAVAKRSKSSIGKEVQRSEAPISKGGVRILKRFMEKVF